MSPAEPAHQFRLRPAGRMVALYQTHDVQVRQRHQLRRRQKDLRIPRVRLEHSQEGHGRRKAGQGHSRREEHSRNQGQRGPRQIRQVNGCPQPLVQWTRLITSKYQTSTTSRGRFSAAKVVPSARTPAGTSRPSPKEDTRTLTSSPEGLIPSRLSAGGSAPHPVKPNAGAALWTPRFPSGPSNASFV